MRERVLTDLCLLEPAEHKVLTAAVVVQSGLLRRQADRRVELMEGLL